MSKIAMVLVVAGVALASPAAVEGNGRDDGVSSRLSQYCVPQAEHSGAQTLYC
jgi:hypothetical protein